MKPRVSYVVDGKYDGKAIAQAQQGFKGLSETAKGLKTALGAIGAVASVKVLVSQFKEATKTFKENNKVQTQMFQALSSNAKTAKGNIKELVKEFDSMAGIFSGADIVKGGTLLARMGLDEDQIRATTKAAKDLASSGVMTLEQAFESLGKSYGGNITQLKKLFPELQTLTKDELEAGKAVELLGKKFAGMESALGGTFEGQISILQNKIDSIKDTIGTMGGFLVQTGYDDMSRLLDKVSDVANKFMPSIAAWTTTIIHAFANFDIAKIFDPKTTFEAWKNMFEVMAKNFLAVFDFLKAKIKGVWTQNELDASIEELARAKSGRDTLMAKASNKGLSEMEQYTLDQLQTTITMLEENIEEQQDLMKVKGKSLAELMSDMVYNTGEGMKKNLSLITGEDMAAYYESQREKYGEYKENNISSGAGGGTGSGTGTSKSASGNWSIFGNSIEDQVKAFKESLFGNLGDIGTVITAALEDSWLGVILKVISSAVSVIGEKTTVLTEIMSLFDTIFRSLFTPEFINMLNQFFGPVLSAISSIFSGIGYIVGILSEVFTPILNGVGKCVEIISKVIQSVLAVCYNIYVACWNFFHSKKNEKEYKSLSDIWSSVSTTDYSNYSAGMYSAGTTTSSGSSNSASYTAARDVIVNISFNNSYVNGDARQIAVSLWNEIKAAERMGYIS